MEIRPDLKVIRFAKAEVGDLILYPSGPRLSVCLKCADIKEGDECVAVLGPEFPLASGPHLLDAEAETIVSIGKNFAVQLPVCGAGWTLSEPDRSVPSIAMAGEKIFFRVNYARTSGRWAPCLIDAATGKIHSKAEHVIAYATQYALVIPNEIPERERAILTFGES